MSTPYDFDRLIFVIRARMAELEPTMREYRHEMEKLEILDAWEQERNSKAPIRGDVLRWIKSHEAGDPFRVQGMADEFGQNYGWAYRWCTRLERSGMLERFGKAQFRRPLNRTGEATLRVLTR